jgi:benzoyl-CoA reductase subunit BamC
MVQIRRTIKSIKIDADKCNGCRMCESICSAFHSIPQYGTVNPARSRIRIFWCEEKDIYVPIKAGKNTEAPCSGRVTTEISGKQYGECSFCRRACPARDLFHEPDSGLPLECDMCGEPMPEEPMCVKFCKSEALTYEEREEEVTEAEEARLQEMEVGLQSMIDRHGFQKIVDAVARLSKKE